MIAWSDWDTDAPARLAFAEFAPAPPPATGPLLWESQPPPPPVWAMPGRPEPVIELFHDAIAQFLASARVTASGRGDDDR